MSFEKLIASLIAGLAHMCLFSIITKALCSGWKCEWMGVKRNRITNSVGSRTWWQSTYIWLQVDLSHHFMAVMPTIHHILDIYIYIYGLYAHTRKHTPLFHAFILPMTFNRLKNNFLCVLSIMVKYAVVRGAECRFNIV